MNLTLQVFALCFICVNTCRSNDFVYIYLTKHATGQTITNHWIDFYTTNSMVECAAFCAKSTQCVLISYQCADLRAGRPGRCILVSEESSNNSYSAIVDLTMCTMKVEERVPFQNTGQSQNITSLTNSDTSPLQSTETAFSVAMHTNMLTSSVSTETEISTIPTTKTGISYTSTEMKQFTAITVTKESVDLPSTDKLYTATKTATNSYDPAAQSGSQGFIIDVIDNVNCMCDSNSQNDLAVITADGKVYFYDDFEDLTMAYCKKQTIYEVFTGFPQIPSVSQWKALLTYNRIYIDLFTDSQVFRWQKNWRSLHAQSFNYPKDYAAYLQEVIFNSPTVIFSRPTWAVVREYLGSMDLYFYNGSSFYFYSIHPPKEARFIQSETSLTNHLNKPLNPWLNLPSNVEGVTAANNLEQDFIIITSDLNVFYYEIEQPDTLDPPPQAQLRGRLVI